MLAGTGAGGSLGEGGPTPAQGRGVLHQRHDPVLPGSSSSGQDREWVPRGGSPGAWGRSDPILKSLQPSCRTGHHSWVGMWHPEGMAPYFGGHTCAPRQLRRDVFVCLAGKGLTPGGFWGAGVSPAGYTQAAPRTGDLTPLPWQRLVKSPRAGRLPRAWGAGMGAWEAAPRPPRCRCPRAPSMSCVPASADASA